MIETKDLFYIIGISSTILIGLMNYFISIKNRRNSLREHLYKEQFIFFKEIMTAINNLNIEIQSLINDSSKRSENDFDKLLKDVVDIYTILEFLPPEDIRGNCHDLIFKANQYYMSFLTSKFELYSKSYNTYYEAYSRLVNSIQGYVGTKNLSRENMLLHRTDDRLQKLSSEIANRIFKK